jgi:dTDP-4-dehydrorhamnose reductase
MKIVITGAGGLVGAEFVKRFSKNHQVLALNHEALDITERRAVRRLICGERPELVINCAVVGVDASQRNPALAQAVNCVGAENLARMSAEIEAEFLHLSTNYVFDGERQSNSFYTINDAASPVNVYGETKLAGERAVLSAASRSFIIRTSWVFGHGKENFFSTAHRRLRAAEPLRATTNIRASATYVADLAARVEEILARHCYATYHVVNSGGCSSYEFALEAARILKMTKTEIDELIEPVEEEEMRRGAKRPRSTPMRCLVSEELGFAPMRDWRLALRDYIQST